MGKPLAVGITSLRKPHPCAVHCLRKHLIGVVKGRLAQQRLKWRIGEQGSCQVSEYVTQFRAMDCAGRLQLAALILKPSEVIPIDRLMVACQSQEHRTRSVEK